jgi:hypothetical protein
MNLRAHLVETVGKYMIDEYIAAVKGEKEFDSISSDARVALWDIVSQIILQTDATVKIPGLAEGSISDQVDMVLTAVADSQIEIGQGKKLIEMLQAGFEITELKELVGRLAEAGVDIS